MASVKPELHLGNMTFAWAQASSPVDDAVAAKMIDTFAAAGGVNFDTARIYAAGKSEEMTGRVMTAQASHDKFVIATKASPSQENGLTPAGIRAQLDLSLSSMQTKKVAVLYLHQPDKKSSVADSLVCLDELVKEGLIERIGLSNYSAVEVERVMAICKAKSLTPPTVYQGLYNPINRRVVDELFPTLQAHGIAFVAYNPLAAGMLTGKHVKDAEVQAGRFKDNKNYMDRFYKPDTFAALELINAACVKHGVAMTQATFSWMLLHSGMGPKDGLLLGASKVEHLEQNLACCSAATELHADILAAYDEAWGLTKSDAFAYWRGYSMDQPGGDDMDQGGEYAVKK